MGDTSRDEPSASAVRRTGGKAARPGRPASRAEPAEPAEPDRRADAAGRVEPGGRGAARRRIGIRELRQHASIYVDLAERGYTVDITNRGRLVARLVPVREAGSPLERLVAAGILEPAEEPGGVADIEPYPVTARSAADARSTAGARLAAGEEQR